MAKHSKRYNEAKSGLTEDKKYSVAEAVAAVKQHPTKFDATVELHVKLGIDPKKSDQVVRGSVSLPHGTGKDTTVAAFVSPNHEDEAKAAGADFIGNEDFIAEIKKTGKVEFDVAVATPDMMKKVGPIARVLGQKGVMPNPKTQTVGTDVTKMVTELKAGKVNFKNDSTGNVHMPTGKVSFSDENLVANIEAALEAVRKSKPSAAKGTFMVTATLASSMGPGLRLQLSN